MYSRDFLQACYLEGNVTNALTGTNISSATVKILNTIMPNSSSTNLNGYYTSGNSNLLDFSMWSTAATTAATVSAAVCVSKKKVT